MRTLYIKLKNFKGIAAGMGMKEIEIDFTKTDKRIILFLGANGSGKSTIMSQLHPFMESFDSRDSLILDGCEGYKEIHIQNGDDVYRIEHYYGKGKNKSFIYKNDSDVPLNEGGGIRTFMAHVQQELGVTPEFFKIVKIGSNSKNFVDLQSSARKQFLGNFTPSIEEYVLAHKVVAEKLLLSNKEIKYIADELGKLEDKDEVKSRIEVLSRTLKKNNQSANKIAADLIALDSETAKAEAAVSKFSKELAEREEKRKILAEKTAELNELYSQYPKLAGEDREGIKARRKKLDDEIKAIEKELQTSLLELEKLQAAKLAASNNKSAAEAERRKYSKSSDGSVDSLRELRVTKADALKKAEEALLAIEGYSAIPAEADAEEATEQVNEASRMALDLIEGKRLVQDMPEDMVEALFTKGEDKLDEEVRTLESRLKKRQEQLTALRAELRRMEDDVVASKATFDVASLCKSKTCKVYEIGQQQKLKKDELGDKRETVELMETAIAELEGKIENLRTVRRYCRLFQSGVYMFIDMHEYPRYKEELALLLDAGAEIGRAILESTPDEITELFDLAPLVRKINLTKKVTDLKVAIEGIDSRIESLSDIESFLTDIQTRIETASKEIAEIGPKEQELKENVEELRGKLGKKESARDILAFIDTALVEVAQAEKELKTLEKVYETNIDSIRVIEESVSKKKELEQQKADADELVEETTTELASYNAKLVRITEYEERQAALTQSRDLLKVVKEALDIKTGIPLYLLGSYLEGIKEETNRLLNLAFGDGFSIDFEVSDTDFNIPVYKNGTPFGKDITDCSQGETALVKCSLSLGITSRAIRQAETKYNLVYLDEVDAELDTNNRYKFLEILEKQLDALACEQCFAITHNDAFLNAEVGLVMLKGATFDISDESAMFNKDVIADFRKEIQ